VHRTLTMEGPMMQFRELTAAAAGELVIDGEPLSQLTGEPLLQRARSCGLPKLLSDEEQIRLLLGTLLKSGAALSPGVWGEVREEAAGLLLHAVKREGCLPESTAAALNVLNKPQVVEKYTTKGNRWTIADACRDPSVARARKELGDDGPGSTGEWLRHLGEALDEPVDERPWYTSKAVLGVLFLAFLFIAVHIILLVRVIVKVHTVDNRVLLYPIAGLSASAIVGGFAIGIHRMSDPPKKD